MKFDKRSVVAVFLESPGGTLHLQPESFDDETTAPYTLSSQDTLLSSSDGWSSPESDKPRKKRRSNLGEGGDTKRRNHTSAENGWVFPNEAIARMRKSNEKMGERVLWVTEKLGNAIAAAMVEHDFTFENDTHLLLVKLKSAASVIKEYQWKAGHLNERGMRDLFKRTISEGREDNFLYIMNNLQIAKGYHDVKIQFVPKMLLSKSNSIEPALRNDGMNNVYRI